MLEYILKKLIRFDLYIGFFLLAFLGKIKGEECYFKINNKSIDGIDVYFRWK